MLSVLVLAIGAISQALATGAPSSIAARTDACSAFNPVPFYRAYNGKNVDHFYTRSLPEVISASPTYVLEGSAGGVLATNATGAIPLFRLYNTNLVDHFYTVDAGERGGVIAGGGWADEGIAAFILQQPQCGTVALYRLFQGKHFDHFYTTDITELSRAIAQDGYVFEGTIGYIWPAAG